MSTFRAVTNPDGSFNHEALEDLEEAIATCEDMHYIIQQQSTLIRNMRTALDYIVRRAKSSLATHLDEVAPHE